MLNKSAAHPILQHDSDLKLFLESDAFNVDVKNKERKDPVLGESKGMFSGMLSGGGGKFIEHDDVRCSLVSSRATFNIHSGSMIGRYILMPWRTSSRLSSKQLTLLLPSGKVLLRLVVISQLHYIHSRPLNLHLRSPIRLTVCPTSKSGYASFMNAKPSKTY